MTGDVVGTILNNSATTTSTIAFTYKLNDFSVVANGGTVLTDTSGDLPTSAEITALNIGSFNGFGRINGTIYKIAYYPLKLTDSQIRNLTL